MISKISNHWSLMIFQISDISEIQDLEYGVCNFMHLYIYFHHVMTITNLDIIVFSRESDSTIANVRLSVCLSQKPLSISESLLLTLDPIDHRAYQPFSL